MAENYLIISDLQIPFEHDKALDFCKYIKKHYKIAEENVISVGDEVDQYFGSLYLKDPDASHTANSEIQETRDTLQAWIDAFPVLRVCESNHGQRWAKKASVSQIPSQLLRTYQEVLQIPLSWQYKRIWKIPASKHPFKVLHGLEFSGKHSARNALDQTSTSVAFGHLHSSAAIAYLKTFDKSVWAMNTGCLINPEAYAFHYGKDSKQKPNLGTGVVCDGGKIPIWLPLE